MTMTATYEKLGLSKPWEQLERVLTEESLRHLKAESGNLVKDIQQGTVTVDEIDTFLRKTHQLSPAVEEYLIMHEGIASRPGR